MFMSFYTFGSVIKLLDAHGESKETAVDIFGLSDRLFFVMAGLIHAFRSRQINEMQFTDRPHISAHLLRVYLDDKDTMRSRGSIIHRCLGDNTICISNK